jgi:hypothetical protein
MVVGRVVDCCALFQPYVGEQQGCFVDGAGFVGEDRVITYYLC